MEVPRGRKNEESSFLGRCCFAAPFVLLFGGFLVYLNAVHYLKHDEQLLIETRTEKWVINGPGKKITNPFHGLSHVRKGTLLEQQQYMHIKDLMTGDKRLEHGPGLVFLRAYDQITTHATDAINLDRDTAVRVLDTATGQQRLVTGGSSSPGAESGRFFPQPTEIIKQVETLIRVEPHQVVIAQDAQGAYHFFGGGLSGDGGSHAANGTLGSRQGGTAFFLQPHWKLIHMQWSSATEPTEGTASERAPPIHDAPAASAAERPAALAYKVNVTKIDLRARYTAFQYHVRTLDNVELVLEGTCFWQVVDVPTLISATSDPVGDVYQHARSSLIQAVSKVTLESFMSGFNELVSRAASTDGAFYAARGVRLNTLEVTSYKPADESTARVLEQIIQETTNRINRLQQQRSQNEVERERLQAEVAIEAAKRQLLTAKAENDKLLALEAARATSEVSQLELANQLALETARLGLVNAKADNDHLAAAAEGEARGLRFSKAIGRFAAEMSAVMPNATSLIELYSHLHRLEIEAETVNASTSNLGSGSASLFLTPSDLNLRLAVAPTGATPTPIFDGDEGVVVASPPPPPPPPVQGPAPHSLP